MFRDRTECDVLLPRRAFIGSNLPTRSHYFWIARHLLTTASGRVRPARALSQAIRLSGIRRRIETRRDAQRMREMAHGLPAASTKTSPIDAGATIRRFPAADAA